MSISGGMDEEMVVYSYSVKRRSTIKMNKLLIHATEEMNLKKLKMLVKEANHQPDDSILCETREDATNLRCWRSGYALSGSGDVNWLEREMRETSRGGMFHILSWVMGHTMITKVKIHRVVHLGFCAFYRNHTPLFLKIKM